MAGIKKYTIIAFLIFSLVAVLFLIFKTTGFAPKASSSSPVALENSYLFASPLQAKADGQEKIRITVFILDGKGLGISNQNISLNDISYIKIENIQSTTDSYGKAIFDLTSTMPKQSKIQAKIGKDTIPQPVTVTFY